MAVAITSKVNGVNNNLGTNGTITVTGLTTAGASLILIAVQIGNNSTSSVSSATVNGNAATQAKAQLLPDGFSNAEIWWYWSPSALASVSVVVNFSNSAGAGCLVLVDEATGTDASSIGNTGGAQATSGTSAASVTCSSSGSVMYGSALNFAGADTAGANTAVVQQTNDAAGDFGSSSRNTQSTTSGTSYTITTTHTSQAWGLAIAEIKPGGSAPVAAAPPSGIPPFLMRGPGRFRAGPRLRTTSFAATPLPSGQMAATATISVAGSAALTGAGALVAVAAMTFAGTAGISGVPFTALTVTPRYIAQGGQARFIQMRTVWAAMMGSAAEHAALIADCVAEGYDGIEFGAIWRDGPFRATRAPFANDGADLPFTTKIGGGAWGGSTVDPDFTTPNSPYWNRFLALVDGFAAVNKIVKVFPAYTGTSGGGGSTPDDGWANEMVQNGNTRMQTYGAWITNLCKDRANIIWGLGGDAGTANRPFTGSERDAVCAMVNGMLSVSGQLSTNFGAEWGTDSIGDDQTDFLNGVSGPTLGSTLTIQTLYNFFGGFIPLAKRAFAQGTKPTFVQEGPFADEDQSGGTGFNAAATPRVSRFYWWAATSGAFAGINLGNGWVWPFNKTGSAPLDNWQNHLNTQGDLELQVLARFFRSIAFWKLVPDGTSGMRTLIVANAGSGTGRNDDGPAGGETTTVSAACADDGSFAIAYRPRAHGTTFDFDPRSLKRPYTGYWLDTGNGAATPIAGIFSNLVSAQTFTPPGSNSAGETDWLLVLTAQTAYGSVPTTPFQTVGPGRRRSPAGAGKARLFAETVTTTSGVMSATASMTIGGSAAIAGAGALGATSTITAAGTASLVGGGALSGSPGLAFAGSATVAGSGAAAATATITVGGTAALVGAGALAAASTLTVGGTAAASGAGALRSTATMLLAGTAALAGAGSLVAGAAITFAGSAALAGAGTMVASATLAVGGSAVLAGAGAMAGTPTVVFGGTATIGSGAISATGSMSFGGSAGAAGAGALAASSALIFAGSATATGAGALAATASATLTGNATLAGSAAASATAPISFAVTAALKGAGALAGIPTITFGGFANTGGQITAFVSFAFGGSAALAGAGAMVAVATASFAGTAALGGSAPAAATGALTIAGAAQLGAAGALRATAALVFGGSATLTGASPNVGTIVFGGSGVLKGAAALAAMGTVMFGGTANIAGGAVLPPLAHVGSGGTKAGGSGGPTRAKRT